MSVNLFCKKHKDQKITLACLSSECDNRFLCSKCPRESHPKHHFVDTISSVVNKGFVGLFYDFGSLDIPISQQIDLDDSFQNIANVVKTNLESSLETFEKNQKEFEKIRYNLKMKINEKCNHLSKYDSIFTNSKVKYEDFASQFEKGLTTIYSFKKDKEIEEISLIKFKIELLNNIFANYIRLMSLLFNNTFGIGLNTYLNQQAEILNKFSPLEVENSTQYLSFLDQRFRKEYLQLERTLTDSLSNLSNQINILMQGEFTIQRDFERNQKLALEQNYHQIPENKDILPTDKEKKIVYVAKKAVSGKGMLSGNFKRNHDEKTNHQSLPYKKSISSKI